MDRPTRHCKTLGWIGAILLWLPQSGWGEVALATKPLVIPAPLAPNVVLTVEEAGTMRRGVPPHSPNISDTPHGSVEAKRYHYSSHYNPLYYNPDISYKVPAGYSTSFDAARKNGYDMELGTVILGNSYRPTYSYDPVDKTYVFGKHPKKDVDSGKFTSESQSNNVRAYYYRFKKDDPHCDPVNDKEVENCYSLELVDANEEKEKNFANWYSFYRTRYLATLTALHLVMPKLEGKIRLAWQGTSTTSGNYCMNLSGSNCKDRTGATYDNGLRPFAGDHKTKFYQWLSRLGSGAEPSSMREAMKRVGDYLSHPKRYCENPNNEEDPTTNPARSCRDNVHIMISDGEQRDSGSVALPGDGDVDSKAFAKGEAGFAIAYTPQVPYRDYPLDPKPTQKNANTLADIAFYYWARDLVPSLENNILPFMPDQTGTTAAAKDWNPRNNPATWQHIVNYTVITGMSYVLGDDWGGDTYNGKQAKGEKNWPKVGTGGDSIAADPGRVYDYWHAALNSRGQFFGVDEVDRLIEALEAIARRLEARQAAAAAISANSTRLDTGSAVYQALYHTADWRGELIATALNADGTLGAKLWEAAFPAHGARNIITWSGSAGTPFTWDGLTAAQKDAFKSTVAEVFGSADDAKAQAVLNWLRGYQGQEQTFDKDNVLTGGTYRKRSSVLGDIVNSDPAFVADQDFGHAVLPEGQDTAGKPYKAFVAGNKGRVKLLYVGANDGMLHGFIAGAGTGGEHACGGSGTEKLGLELFAYVPGALVKELPRLSHPAYEHRYYVDGAPHVGDAYLPTLSADKPWRTVLLGTTGAGGRVIFALDVTNPCEFGPDKVLWERDQTWDADLGYTLAKPVIARLNNGKWAAVFGNGYGSGKAVLFVVDLKDGTLIKKFDVGGSGNGLAAPSLYDKDGNGTVDIVYAGDLLGQMWKFDLSAADANGWKVAYDGAPLFTARNASNQVQPITAAPELGAPPSGVSGVMVYFGTGRFFADEDKTDKSVQSLYGILDNGTAIAGTDRSMLQSQQILSEGVDAGSGRRVRTVSNNAVSYNTQRGWYLDLLPPGGPAQGERVVSTPRRQFQRAFFTTLIPSADPCKFGGTSWVMELRPDSGGITELSIFDLPGLETSIAGLMTTVGIIESFEFLFKGGKGVMVDLGSTGLTESTPIKPPVAAMGRVSWREIID
jgi:type IV pilus assembly protein PilY1